MEIGVKTKFTWQAKLTIVIVSGIMFAVSQFLLNHFIFKNEVTTNLLIAQGIFYGLLFGLGFPPLLTLLATRLYSKKERQNEPILFENETLEAEGPANLFRGWEGVGGKLILTNQRLIFNSHKFNIKTGQTDVLLSDIESCTIRKTFGIVNNGILIKTKEGTEYKLVVNEREKWLSKMNAFIS